MHIAVQFARGGLFLVAMLATSNSSAMAQALPYNNFNPTWSANHLGTLHGLIHWNPQGMVATPVTVRNAPARPFPGNDSWYPPGQGIPPRFAPVAPTQFGPWAATYQLSAPPPELGFQGTTVAGKGIVVDEVTPGGPADQMGLKTGDVIVRINSRAIRRASDLYAAIRNSSGPARVIVRDAKSGRFEQLNAEDFGDGPTSKAVETGTSTEPDTPAQTSTPVKTNGATNRNWPRPRPLVQSTSADPHPIETMPANEAAPKAP